MLRAPILITGAGGFVAAHLARRIAGAGGVALGLGIELTPSAPRGEFSREWRVDLADRPRLSSAVAEAEPAAVVHLAGQSSVADSFERPIETFEANAGGTWNLLEAVRTAAPEARVLVIGSGDIYGPQPAGSRAPETAPLRPVSPYALSKAVAEAAALFYAERFGTDVVCTRSFAHIGTGQSDRFVVPAMARQIAEIEQADGREAVIHAGNLEVTRDVTTVDSVAEAYLALLERGRAGTVYNVCSGEPTTLSQLVERLARLSRRPVRIEVSSKRARAVDVPYLVGDPSRIQQETGWRAAPISDDVLGEILGDWRARIRPAPRAGP
jgi:GDP-4-dehydro-6-deoxy-D-mannose reductase